MEVTRENTKYKNKISCNLMYTKSEKKLKEPNGITLMALAVTIVILIILAGISIGVLTGENGLLKKAINAKEQAEISNEKEIVELSSVQAMQKHKRGIVTQNGLQTQLDKNTEKGITNVIEEIEDKVLLAKFLKTERIYEVDEDGNVIYLGKETELMNQATITASPSSNTTPELVQEVKLTVKTPLSVEDENITLIYAWNQNENENPDATNYIKATLTGTQKTRNAIITSNDTVAGNYYLWVKVLVGNSEITECFGPYVIKDHTTLIACNSGDIHETGAESGFLGNTSLTRNTIESVTIATSFGAHSLSDSNCWVISQSQDGKYLAWYEDNDGDGYEEVTIAGNGGVVANTNSSYLFAHIGYDVKDTVEIKGIENLDTGLVTNMRDMFCNCRNITSLYLRTFNTSNVTSLFGTFEGCTNLENLNVSNWNTSNVIEMGSPDWSYGGLFQECKNLKNIDVSNWDTSKVILMGNMFCGCNQLNSLNVTNFDTKNVTYMNSMFNRCGKLTSIDVSKFNTINVKNMMNIFWGCSQLSSVDVSNFNTSNVTNIGGMFNGCSQLSIVDVTGFNTSNVLNMQGMFFGCSQLSSIDVSKFDTSNVTSMSGMFHSCNSLTNLNLNNFDTSNVTSMWCMFSGCSQLSSIDVSNFDTSNVADMQSMFNGCSNLTSLNISNFNTSNVTNMSGMFQGCSQLSSIDVSNFDTSKVTNMQYMFLACRNLTCLNISNFNTSNVTIYFNMLTGVPKTVVIKTNADTKKWIEDNFPDYKDCISII